MTGKLIMGLILIGFTFLVIFQNSAPVSVHILIWDLSLSNALLIFIIFTAGTLFGWLLQNFSILGITKEQKKSVGMTKERKKSEEKLQNQSHEEDSPDGRSSREQE